MENDLPKADFDALKSLIRNKELIIQKTDRDNTVVLLNKKDYISKMKVILADTPKIKKIQIDDSKVVNNLIHMEKQLLHFSKNLKKNKTFLIKSTIDYTLQVQDQVFCKVQKSIVDGVPSTFIVSYINWQTFLYHY